VPGTETVLLFAHDPVASLARPVLELKGMAKIGLEPGAEGSVRFSLDPEELAFLGHDLKPRLEPGTIELLVGSSADRQSLIGTSIELRPTTA
jgi:beta-glucosidase